VAQPNDKDSRFLLYRTTEDIPEESNFHSHYRENRYLTNVMESRF